jgi:endonuclease-3
MGSDQLIKSRAREIDRRLNKLYPGAETSLHFSNPLELLIATILSAQCTDERVNLVTKSLFEKYKNAKDYVKVTRLQLEQDIHSTGFFRNKAKSIRNCCTALLDHFDGKIPDNLDDMVKLPGVGRKTANLVLGECFNLPGIVVDTHVKRLAQRLGLTQKKDPVKIEFDLMALLPENRWTQFSHELICHGRNTCKARKPDCMACILSDICPWPDKTI